MFNRLFNKDKEKHLNIKTKVLVSLCLMFILMFSCVFVFVERNLEKQNFQPVQEVSNESIMRDDGVLRLKWGSSKSERTIKPMNNISKGENGYVFDTSAMQPEEPIAFGTTITVGCVSGVYYIYFGSSDKYATLTIMGGYELEKICFGNSSSEEVVSCTPDNYTSFSTTPDIMDPYYTGTLVFSARVSASPYSVDFFYVSGSEYRYHNIEYTCKDPIYVSSKDVLDGKTWFLNVSKISGYSSGQTSAVYAPAGGGKNITFSLNTSNTKGSWVEIVQISGYGNFIGGDGQRIDDPTIVGWSSDDLEKKYKITIENSESDWEGVNNSLYGVKPCDGGSGGKKYTLSDIDKNSSIKFRTESGNAFKDTVVADDYYLFNYGYGVKGYIISYGENKFIGLTGSNWEKKSSETEILIESLSSKSFGNLIQFFNENILIGLTTVPDITIKPTWDPVSLTVKCNLGTYSLKEGKTTTIAQVDFAESYSSLEQVVEDPIGQKFFTYKQDENYIALNGIWNYTNLDVSYSSVNGYVVNVEPFALNNIYKVELKDVLSSTSYELENTSFSFRTSSNTNRTNAQYSYLDLEGVLNAHNPSTYPLIENYVEAVVNGYIENYNNKIANSSYDVFNKVYYSTGTLNGNILNATNPKFHIYVAHNQNIDGLPAFKNEDALLVGWIENGGYRTTNSYSDTYQAEFEALSEAGAWLYEASNVQFKAKYVYAGYLYYQDNNPADGIYSAKKISYYGKTKLPLNTYVPDSKPNGKGDDFKWVFNKSRAAENSVVYNEDYKELSYTNPEGYEFVFEVEKINESNADIYYITAIQGDYIFTQNHSNPIVYATWFGNSYNLTIDNSSDIYWNTISLKETKENFYGAYSNKDDHSNFEKISITIVNSGPYAYGFQTNNLQAFFKKSDYNIEKIVNSKVDVNNDGKYIDADDSYYYVYNYGHYINGWRIQATNNGVTKHYKFNGSTWIVKNPADVDANFYSTNSSLEGVTLRDVAGLMDEFYADSEYETALVMSPVWLEAQVAVWYDSNNSKSVDSGDVTSSSFDYGSDYSLDSMSDVAGGKFFTFKAVSGLNGQNIAMSGTWNYTNNIGAYVYDNYVYYWSVEPVYLNNVYKVELNGIFSATSYELENTSFSFRTSSDTNYTNDQFSYLDLKGAVDAHNSTTYPLIEDYVEMVVNKYEEDYNNKITNSSYDVFNKVYYSTGTLNGNILNATSPQFHIYIANNQTVSSLPMFKHEFAKLIAWEDKNESFKTDGFEEKFIDELSHGCIDVWGYSTATESTKFVAKYVYRLDLYYEDANSSDGVYSTISDGGAKWYGEIVKNSFVSGPNQIYNPGDSNIPSDKNFANWMVNLELARDGRYLDPFKGGAVIYGYDCSVDEGNKKLTISNGSFSLTVQYTQKSFYHDFYYGITSIYGSGIFVQNAKDAINSYPIITAKLANSYDLTIDNTNTYWKSYETILSDKEKIFGAYSNVELDSSDGFKRAKIEISNTDIFSYPFQNNIEKAFYKKDDYTISNVDSKVDIDGDSVFDNFYYVYNYGYHITHWTIECSGVIFHFDGTDWIVANMPSEIGKLGLNTTLKDVAASLDDYFSAETGTLKSVSMYPTWEAAQIDAIDSLSRDVLGGTRDGDGNIANKAKFGENYVLDSENLNKANYGQALFSFSLAGDSSSLISYVYNNSYSGKWNYRNIAYDKYTYSDDVYTISLSPVFVDNIYKVTLENVKYNSSGVYKLSGDFEFNSSVGDDVNSEEIKFNSTKLSYYDFNAYRSSSYVLIDDYIDDLKTYLTNWNNGIKGDFELFKKVYYSSGTVSTDKSDNDTLTANNPDFHIYLANNQETGLLPVFNKENYDNIFWRNEYHTNNIKCEYDNDDKVDCQSRSSNYIYLTEKYNEDAHAVEVAGYKQHVDNTIEGVGKVDSAGIWSIKDGHDGNKASLYAHYFRIYYYLDISTIFVDKIERRGYVHVNIYDSLHNDDPTVDDEGGDFIIIAEPAVVPAIGYAMAIYKLNVGYSLSSLNDSQLKDLVWVPNNAVRINNLKLYAGCDLTINVKDQSKDFNAMATGNFDEMIGFKFNKNIKIINPDGASTSLECENYQLFANADLIQSCGYNNDDLIKLDIYFEEIAYSLNFKIDSLYAGSLTVGTNSTNTSLGASHTLNNIKVLNVYRVQYYAYAGYKLQNNAFTLNGLVLQQYDENIGNISQEYVLTKGGYGNNLLNGTWLREYFYNNNNNYAVENVNLGELLVQTCPIEFNFGVKIWDETDSSKIDNQYIIETLENIASVQLVNGNAVLPNVGNYLTDEELGFWHYVGKYDIYNGIKFAMLSSRLYIPNNHKTKDGNFYRAYDFLLEEKPDHLITINHDILAKMVKNYSSGTIISTSDRDIFIMLEVRKIYKINMYVEALDNDSNDTLRTINVCNSQTLIYPNAQIVGGKFMNSENTTCKVVYTYHNQYNTIIFSYDDTRYAEVSKYLGGVVFDLGFSLTNGDKDLVIKFVPKLLNVKYTYSLDGNVINQLEKLEDYISEDLTIKPKEDRGYALNDKIPYQVSGLNIDYDVKVTINNTFMGSTNLSARDLMFIDDGNVDNRYLVTTYDYNIGFIEIKVECFKMDSTKINVKYQLIDDKKKTDYDVESNFGTLEVVSVYLNVERKLDKTEYGYSVYQGRNVKVVVNLNEGYEFKGFRHNNFLPTMVSLDPVEKSFMMITDFDEIEDSGVYVLLIDKKSVSANLDVAGKKAQYLINGKTNLNDLYVGAKVNLSSVEVDEERLDYFFYTDKSGKKVILTNDGTANGEALTSFLITKEVLKQVKNASGLYRINFGVNVVARYKVDFVVQGIEYVKDGKIPLKNTTTGSEYKSGTYVDVGTNITFSVATLAEGKYSIAVKQDGVVLGTYDVVNENDIGLDLINSNIVCMITVSPKTYKVNISEMLYDSLSSVINESPSVVTIGKVNNVTVSGQGFNQTTTLEFVKTAYKTDKTTLDRTLSKIIISKNDHNEGDDVIIVFNKDGYVAYKNSIDEANLVSLEHYGYTLGFLKDLIKDNITLTYTTKNEISITLEYKDYKVISAG